MLMNDPITQLREVEACLNNMSETWDYIETKAEGNYDLSKRFAEADRQADKYRK